MIGRLRGLPVPGEQPAEEPGDRCQASVRESAPRSSRPARPPPRSASIRSPAVLRRRVVGLVLGPASTNPTSSGVNGIGRFYTAVLCACRGSAGAYSGKQRSPMARRRDRPRGASPPPSPTGSTRPAARCGSTGRSTRTGHGRALSPSPRAAPHGATWLVARRPSGRGARAVPGWRGTASSRRSVARRAGQVRRAGSRGKPRPVVERTPDPTLATPTGATERGDRCRRSGERPSVELHEDVAAAGTMIIEESLVVEEAVDVVVEGDVVVEESIVLEEPEVAEPTRCSSRAPAPGPGVQRRGPHRRSPSLVRCNGTAHPPPSPPNSIATVGG